MTAPHWIRRRLLEAFRSTGAIQAPPKDQSRRRKLKCFRLDSSHLDFAEQPITPVEFHQTLCDRIRNASHRVYLASLYIGPAASESYEKEIELLDALQHAMSKNVDMKILLDRNRALRPVPLSEHPGETTTSADACLSAISRNLPSQLKIPVYLLSVLPFWLQDILPNPQNEVAGVFHIKAYIIDDDLILSGANLSEEYFVDRIDRYLWIKNGGQGLVDCYADLVSKLCRHARRYSGPGTERNDTALMDRQELLQELVEILTVPESYSDPILLDEEEELSSKAVAYAVPTLSAPPHYFSSLGTNDEFLLKDNMEALIQTASELDSQVTVRISTPYVNPVPSLVDALQLADQVHILTASYLSHGFRPKAKAGNKGKAWIPAVFDAYARAAQAKLGCQLWFFLSDGLDLSCEGCMVDAGNLTGELDGMVA